MLGDLLDNGEIDYAILDVLDIIYKKRKKDLWLFGFYAKQEFLRYPIIKALLDLNILYKSKYYDYIMVEHRMYFEIIKEYIDEKKIAMNQYERIRYKIF